MKTRFWRRGAGVTTLGLLAATILLFSVGVVLNFAQSHSTKPQIITDQTWGAATAPVYGTSEPCCGGAYSTAELFAGPNKFGSYFAGVLPNGRKVTPAGTTIQIGMNPLGVALTPDGKYLITSNDDERETNFVSYQSSINLGGYSLSVINTATMQVVSQYNVTGRFFVGLQVTGTGPYTVWASGGGDNDVKLFNVSATGIITAGTPSHIAILPTLPATQGYVSNYTPGPQWNTPDSNGNLPPAPSGFSRTSPVQTTFPAGSALSPAGHYLYVACNGDNSVAVIDTTALAVVKQVPVGYFPYGVSVNAAGDKVIVSNWGVTEYKFFNPTYDSSNNLTVLGTPGANTPAGFFVVPTSTTGPNPKTSSITLLSAPKGNGAALTLVGSDYEGHPLDTLNNVGDTHPSATAIVHQGSTEILVVTKTNSDKLGFFSVNNNTKRGDVPLSLVSVTTADGHQVHGSYPNALAVSPDNTRLYVAEAGINSVAVLDVSNILRTPVLLGRIPTDWYPTAVTVSPDGHFLYIANAKGIGEDINPNINTSAGSPPPSGVASDPSVDSNFVFGSLQQVDLSHLSFDNTVMQNNFAINIPQDTQIVPIGGKPSSKITHVFFILHENKTYDSMLGNSSTQFRYNPFASQTFNNRDGSTYTNGQYTGVSLNTQAIAAAFASAANYYSDSEESDAGHQFAASGTASDYTEKTLLVKSGRGLLVNKNFETEDYPEGGYIFNNAARHNVSFKDYGALVRVEGTDTGTSKPTTLNDPLSGNVGYPQLQADGFHITSPLVNAGDVSSATQGLGQSYFLNLPVLAILGTNEQSGEPRLDANYPGYNFNISDQRRALEFMSDFDRLLNAGTLPQFVYIYQPNDHTGSVQAPNASTVGTAPLQQIADADVALGMVVNHIMQSSVYYDPNSGQGSAIFVTWDDAQSSLDHIHPHRTPLLVVSPYAKLEYLAKRHYTTASVVKTEELLLGLPPNNFGDLFATDLRDLFQDHYNGITAKQVKFNFSEKYQASQEGLHIWELVKNLDTSAPDRDSRRLGVLIRLSQQADELHVAAEKNHRLTSRSYQNEQKELYEAAVRLVHTGAPAENDD